MAEEGTQVERVKPEDVNILIGSAPCVNVKGSAFEKICDDAIEDWKRQRPAEVTAFLRQMKSLRAMHADGKAYGRSMAFYYIGETPRYIYTYIARALGGNFQWMKDEEANRTWWNRFKAGRINPRDPVPKDPTGQMSGR